MGEKLGCGAHLTALRRNCSGSFHLDGAASLDMLVQAGSEGRLAAMLTSCNEAISQLKRLELNEVGVARVRRGIAPVIADFSSIPDSGLIPGEKVRLSIDDLLVAVAENGAKKWPDEQDTLRLLRVFNEH
jgi:tRNA pseudouridine55 synthase